MKDMDVRKCKYYEEFFGTCSLYVTQKDGFDDVYWCDANCKDIEDCEFKHGHSL